MAQIYCF